MKLFVLYDLGPSSKYARGERSGFSSEMLLQYACKLTFSASSDSSSSSALSITLDMLVLLVVGMVLAVLVEAIVAPPPPPPAFAAAAARSFLLFLPGLGRGGRTHCAKVAGVDLASELYKVVLLN